MNIIKRLALLIVTVAVPLFLMMTAIRLLLSPLFLIVEYNMPGFPEDIYGFTKEDRLHYANISVKYLLNNEGIAFLGDLEFTGGDPVFNSRELGHMVDVKNLVQLMLRVWIGLGVFLLLAGISSWLLKIRSDFWLAISNGGWLTLGLIGLILAGVMLSFSDLFTSFHLLFFEGDTWLFYFSDSLIRLFPMRFWQDGFIFTGIISAAAGLFLALGARRWRSPAHG